MRTFFTSLLSGILGALLVYGAFTISPPPGTNDNTKQAAKTTTVRAVTEPKITEELNAQQIYEQYGDAVVHVKATLSSSYENIFGLPVPETRLRRAPDSSSLRTAMSSPMPMSSAGPTR